MISAFGFRLSALGLIAAVASCWRGPDRPRSPIDEMGWLVGVWHSSSPPLDSEWVRVGRSMYGVAVTDATFEINLIADRDAQSRPRPVTLVSATWTWSGGERSEEHGDFALASADARKLEFVDGNHRVVVVTRTDTGWRGEFRQPDAAPIAFDMTPAPSRADRALEAVDRAATFLEHHTVHGSGVLGDHGYTYGTFAARGRHGSYCHVWRREAGSWVEVAWVTQLE